MDIQAATMALYRAMPEGSERTELLELVRVGSVFKAQHRGRKPGFLRRYISALVTGLEVRTFNGLLTELEYQALRRSIKGPKVSPIEKVDRNFELITWHDPRHGRRQTTFKRVRNIAQLRKIP